MSVIAGRIFSVQAFFMKIKEQFLNHLCREYSDLDYKSLELITSDQLISPFQVQIKKEVLEQAQDAVQKIYAYRNSSEYTAKHFPHLEQLGLKNPHNRSIAMSYDFHIDSDGNLKIIEINTNAAFLILGFQLYKALSLNLPFPNYSMDVLKENILHEIRLNQNKSISHPRICITDDKPTEQRLFLEFLAYQSQFKKWGWECDILDYREIDYKKFDFIYNRYTDFLLSDPSSQKLKMAFNQKEITLSPQPYEYHLLADKERLLELSNVADINKYIPKCFILNPENSEETWAQRKNYFFKPLRSFGSKQTYKAASISRKLFDEIKNQNFMAQEYIQAPSQTFESPEGPLDLKYDLRVYAYEGEAQLVVARLYSGQVTNLKTTYGGFATVAIAN